MPLFVLDLVINRLYENIELSYTNMRRRSGHNNYHFGIYV